MSLDFVGDPVVIGHLPCPVNDCGASVPIHAYLTLEKTGDGVAIDAVPDPTEFQFHMYGHGATIRIFTEDGDNVVETEMEGNE